jgi:hypothetical protein
MGQEMGRFGNTAQSRSLAAAGAARQIGEGFSAASIATGAFAIKYGSALLESENLAGRVFGSMANDIKSWSRTLQGAASLNEYEIRRQAALFFNLATSLKLPRDQALQMSKAMVQLGIDMSSFYDVPVERVMQNLASGLMGNTRALYGYGISLDQATLKNYAYKNGIAQMGSELNKQQKTMAAFGELMKQSGQAHGDFAISFDTSAANQARQITAQLRKELAQLGVGMQEVMFAGLRMGRTIIPAVAGIFNWFSKLRPEVQLTGLAFLAALGPLSRFTMAMYQAQVLRGVAGTFGGFMARRALPIAAIGFTAATVGASYLFRNNQKDKESNQATYGKSREHASADEIFLQSAQAEVERRKREGSRFPGSDNKILRRAIANGQIEQEDPNPGGPPLDAGDMIPGDFPDPSRKRAPGFNKYPNFIEGYREKGGGTKEGKAYVVGEKGPEIFVPTKDGTIIPNHQLSKVQAHLRPGAEVDDSKLLFGGFRADGDEAALEAQRSLQELRALQDKIIPKIRRGNPLVSAGAKGVYESSGSGMAATTSTYRALLQSNRDPFFMEMESNLAEPKLNPAISYRKDAEGAWQRVDAEFAPEIAKLNPMGVISAPQGNDLMHTAGHMVPRVANKFISRYNKLSTKERSQHTSIYSDIQDILKPIYGTNIENLETSPRSYWPIGMGKNNSDQNRFGMLDIGEEFVESPKPGMRIAEYIKRRLDGVTVGNKNLTNDQLLKELSSSRKALGAVPENATGYLTLIQHAAMQQGEYVALTSDHYKKLNEMRSKNSLFVNNHMEAIDKFMASRNPNYEPRFNPIRQAERMASIETEHTRNNGLNLDDSSRYLEDAESIRSARVRPMDESQIKIAQEIINEFGNVKEKNVSKGGGSVLKDLGRVDQQGAFAKELLQFTRDGKALNPYHLGGQGVELGHSIPGEMFRKKGLRSLEHQGENFALDIPDENRNQGSLPIQYLDRALSFTDPAGNTHSIYGSERDSVRSSLVDNGIELKDFDSKQIDAVGKAMREHPLLAGRTKANVNSNQLHWGYALYDQLFSNPKLASEIGFKNGFDADINPVTIKNMANDPAIQRHVLSIPEKQRNDFHNKIIGSNTRLAVNNSMTKEFGDHALQIPGIDDTKIRLSSPLNSKVNIGGNKEVNNRARSIFGRELASHEWAQMVGAPEGSNLTVYPSGDTVGITAEHPWFKGGITRSVGADEDGPFINNETFNKSENAPKHIAPAILEAQARKAAEMGARIRTVGSSGNGKIGYSYWPDLGYDGEIGRTHRNNLPEQYRGANTVQELYAMPGGREAWRKNGSGIPLEFDPREGSLSRQILQQKIGESIELASPLGDKARALGKGALSAASRLGIGVDLPKMYDKYRSGGFDFQDTVDNPRNVAGFTAEQSDRLRRLEQERAQALADGNDFPRGRQRQIDTLTRQRSIADLGEHGRTILEQEEVRRQAVDAEANSRTAMRARYDTLINGDPAVANLLTQQGNTEYEIAQRRTTLNDASARIQAGAGTPADSRAVMQLPGEIATLQANLETINRSIEATAPTNVLREIDALQRSIARAQRDQLNSTTRINQAQGGISNLRDYFDNNQLPRRSFGFGGGGIPTVSFGEAHGLDRQTVAMLGQTYHADKYRSALINNGFIDNVVSHVTGVVGLHNEMSNAARSNNAEVASVYDPATGKANIDPKTGRRIVIGGAQSISNRVLSRILTTGGMLSHTHNAGEQSLSYTDLKTAGKIAGKGMVGLEAIWDSSEGNIWEKGQYTYRRRPRKGRTSIHALPGFDETTYQAIVDDAYRQSQLEVAEERLARLKTEESDPTANGRRRQKRAIATAEKLVARAQAGEDIDSGRNRLTDDEKLTVGERVGQRINESGQAIYLSGEEGFESGKYIAKEPAFQALRRVGQAPGKMAPEWQLGAIERSAHAFGYAGIDHGARTFAQRTANWLMPSHFDSESFRGGGFQGAQERIMAASAAAYPVGIAARFLAEKAGVKNENTLTGIDMSAQGATVAALSYGGREGTIGRAITGNPYLAAGARRVLPMLPQGLQNYALHGGLDTMLSQGNSWGKGIFGALMGPASTALGAYNSYASYQGIAQTERSGNQEDRANFENSYGKNYYSSNSRLAARFLTLHGNIFQRGDDTNTGISKAGLGMAGLAAAPLIGGAATWGGGMLAAGAGLSATAATEAAGAGWIAAGSSAATVGGMGAAYTAAGGGIAGVTGAAGAGLGTLGAAIGSTIAVPIAALMAGMYAHRTSTSYSHGQEDLIRRTGDMSVEDQVATFSKNIKEVNAGFSGLRGGLDGVLAPIRRFATFGTIAPIGATDADADAMNAQLGYINKRKVTKQNNIQAGIAGGMTELYGIPMRSSYNLVLQQARASSEAAIRAKNAGPTDELMKNVESNIYGIQIKDGLQYRRRNDNGTYRNLNVGEKLRAGDETTYASQWDERGNDLENPGLERLGNDYEGNYLQRRIKAKTPQEIREKAQSQLDFAANRSITDFSNIQKGDDQAKEIVAQQQAQAKAQAYATASIYGKEAALHNAQFQNTIIATQGQDALVKLHGASEGDFLNQVNTLLPGASSGTGTEFNADGTPITTAAINGGAGTPGAPKINTNIRVNDPLNFDVDVKIVPKGEEVSRTTAEN